MGVNGLTTFLNAGFSGVPTRVGQKSSTWQQASKPGFSTKSPARRIVVDLEAMAHEDSSAKLHLDQKQAENIARAEELKHGIHTQEPASPGHLHVDDKQAEKIAKVEEMKHGIAQPAAANAATGDLHLDDKQAEKIATVEAKKHGLST